MKNFKLFVIIGLILLSCKQTPKNVLGSPVEDHPVAAVDSIKDGVFIHITESYNDPHRVLMPLKMATLMAKDKKVIIYMDIHAVELLVKSAKDLQYADFESCQTYIRQLAQQNIGIYACPTCLKIAGFKAEDLLEGVQIAQKERFFDFTEGRIITLDY